MRKRLIPLLLILLAILFFLNLVYGSIAIPMESVIAILGGDTTQKASWTHIILDSRLPQALTALFAGGSLAICGLLLQSVFNNPLAGPSILGIDSGASLGVAIVMLLFGGQLGSIPSWFNTGNYITMICAAFIGASCVLILIISFSTIVKSNLMLLIIGIMVGYFASAIISVLNFFSNAQGIQAFTLWGMGDFSSVSTSQIPVFCLITAVGIVSAFMLIKPLNALLLGERYAENLGINVKRVRILLLITTGILTAVTTSFCGPISFIGLAVPHMARLLLKTSNHKLLLPATLLIGSIIALFCNLISTMPNQSVIIPINALTPIVGAPIIIYVILNQKRIQYFN